MYRKTNKYKYLKKYINTTPISAFSLENFMIYYQKYTKLFDLRIKSARNKKNRK